MKFSDFFAGAFWGLVLTSTTRAMLTDPDYRWRILAGVVMAITIGVVLISIRLSLNPQPPSGRPSPRRR